MSELPQHRRPGKTKSVSVPPSLWTTGFVGAVYVLAALAVVLNGVPQLWDISIGSWLSAIFDKSANRAIPRIVQAAAAVGFEPSLE